MKRFRLLIALALVFASLATLTFSVNAINPQYSPPDTETNDTSIEVPPPRNRPPIAENLQYTTYKGICITGKFKALDPDGDTVTFEITSLPKKGKVQPNGTGEFIYSPNEGKKGSDEFTYVAVDSRGGVSDNATVKIEIKKQKTKTTYADMEDNDAYYASLVLAENGIFTGETLGGESFFRPNATVTRGEFLAMCLSAVGTETLSGITKTGFSDDTDIPMWAKPYVSAGLMTGVIDGYRNSEGRIMFNANAEITFSEAAVVINRALGLTDVMPASALTDDDMSIVPAWAQSAAANLTACKILPSGLADIAGDVVTRADAARLIMNSLEVLAARDSGGGGLLSWAK